jgi:hypothetical protein
MSYRAALTKLGTSPQNILFAAMTVKFNRHNKANERAIVFTKDNKIFKLDPKSKYKAMLTSSLTDVTRLSMSPDDGNQLVVVHLHGTSDLLLTLKSARNEDLTGELVGVLTAQFKKMLNKQLDVTVSNQLRVSQGKSMKEVSVRPEGEAAAGDAKDGFAKNKSGGGICYYGGGSKAQQNGH